MEPDRARELVRGTRAPDEAEARARAATRLGEAYAERPVQVPTRRLPVAAATVAALLALVAALSPPGDAVADWVRAAVGLRPHTPTGGVRTAGGRLPSAGRLLVSGGGAAWIVERDGSRRRLGAWSGAAWSPHGRFVAAWQGRRLAALDRRGQAHWSLLAPRPVTNALWSPSGFRVAYRSGQDLRVVAGDGTGDRLLDAGTFTPMAWRPGPAHVLAYSSGGHVDIYDVDSNRRLARIRLPHVPGRLAWSADGTRLYVDLHHSLAVFDARGHRLGRIEMPRDESITTFAPARSGARVAVARNTPGLRQSEVVLAGLGSRTRVLFTASGRFTRLHFSPSGGWLLIAWPLGDQWVYVRAGTSGAQRVLADPRVSERFHRGFPHVSGWCCPP